MKNLDNLKTILRNSKQNFLKLLYMEEKADATPEVPAATFEVPAAPIQVSSKVKTNMASKKILAELRLVKY